MRIWAEARFTRFLIIILAAAAAGAAFKGLRSGWLRPDPPRPVPTYVAGWEELLQIGSRSGPSDAQVDIVEFVDFQCPYCRDAHETLNKVLSKYPDQVALTLVHFPLDYHPYAASAANAYECAREQDDHRAFADRMFTSQDSIGVSPWLWFASPQVDSAQFMACLDRAPADEMVQEALVAARKYSVSATPTILIGGWRYAGAPNRELMNEVIEALLAGSSPPGVSVSSEASIHAQVDTVSGVQHLRFALGALDVLPRLVLGAAPELNLGSEATYQGDFDPSEASWGGRLPDGRLVVYSTRSGVLASFTSDGKGDKILARRGRGPGEIARIAWPLMLDDGTLVTVDRVNNRVTWWPAVGSPIEESQLPDGLPSLIGKPAGAFDRETILLHDAGILRDGIAGEIVRPKASIGILFGRDSAKVVLEVEDLETATTEFRYGGNRERLPDEVRMGLAAHVAVWDTLIAVANKAGFEIDAFTTDGVLVRRISLDSHRRPLTASMRSALVAREVDAARSSTEQGISLGEVRRRAMEAPTADSLQAIGGLFPAADGGLWVLDQIAPGETGWAATLLDREGNPVGRLITSEDGRPVSFSREHVTTISKDEDGLVTVALHRILLPPG